MREREVREAWKCCDFEGKNSSTGEQGTGMREKFKPFTHDKRLRQKDKWKWHPNKNIHIKQPHTHTTQVIIGIQCNSHRPTSHLCEAKNTCIQTHKTSDASARQKIETKANDGWENGYGEKAVVL